MHLEAINADSGSPIASAGERQVYPAVKTADLLGADVSSMSGTNWYLSYHYDLIVQPYLAIRMETAPPEDVDAEGPRFACPATRYLIRATKHLLGQMETAFYVMPLTDGNRILPLNSQEKRKAFAEYIDDNVVHRGYQPGTGFLPDKLVPFVDPIAGSFVAFSIDPEAGTSSFFELLVHPALMAPPALTRFIVRQTFLGDFGDSGTSFYEMPVDQGHSVLAGSSELERTDILGTLALRQQAADLTTSSRWTLLLGRDELHKDIDRAVSYALEWEDRIAAASPEVQAKISALK